MLCGLPSWIPSYADEASSSYVRLRHKDSELSVLDYEWKLNVQNRSVSRFNYGRKRSRGISLERTHGVVCWCRQSTIGAVFIYDQWSLTGESRDTDLDMTAPFIGRLRAIGFANSVNDSLTCRWLLLADHSNCTGPDAGRPAGRATTCAELLLMSSDL